MPLPVCGFGDVAAPSFLETVSSWQQLLLREDHRFPVAFIFSIAEDLALQKSTRTPGLMELQQRHHQMR
eukprot:s151_g23.t1